MFINKIKKNYEIVALFGIGDKKKFEKHMARLTEIAKEYPKANPSKKKLMKTEKDQLETEIEKLPSKYLKIYEDWKKKQEKESLDRQRKEREDEEKQYKQREKEEEEKYRKNKQWEKEDKENKERRERDHSARLRKIQEEGRGEDAWPQWRTNRGD